MPDPDLAIRGGRGGGPQFGLQIRGGSPGPSPGSATEVDVICSIPHILLHFHNIQVMATFGRRL